jgi:RNA polymerase sigma-70 factor (ECF subfamily)
MDAREYAEYRPLMFSIAYRMTGSVGDAEDIVQEGFLRASAAGATQSEDIAAPKAYLATITTRLAIDHLRSARVRRETYVGPWLPEPLLISTEPDPAEHAELSDSLSMAFLVMLESLAPAERAVFLLREVFGYEYGEIADITGKSEQNCRQILTRARRRIAEHGRPRFEASRAESEEVARRFFAAVNDGDLSGLLNVLAPDVMGMGDGGGKAFALGAPVFGRDRVAAVILGLARRVWRDRLSLARAVVNGQLGGIAHDPEGRVVAVIALEIAEGRVQAIRSVVNPDKLTHIGQTSEVMLRQTPRVLPIGSTTAVMTKGF